MTTIHCSKCGRAFAGQGSQDRVASISGSIMGDEYIESYYFCDQCGVYTKGSWSTTRFAKLTYELSAENGTRVRSRALWLRPTTSDISTVKMGIRLYEIPGPGNYILRIQGLKADEFLDDKCEIVFTRRQLARMVGNVIGIVFSAILLIGSSVLFLVRFIANKN